MVGVHVRQEVGCHGHPVVTPEVHGDVHALAQGHNDALRHGVLCALCAAPQGPKTCCSQVKLIGGISKAEAGLVRLRLLLCILKRL